MNEQNEEEVPLNWARRAGHPSRPKPMAVPVPARIPRIARLMALAIKFQDMVDRGEVRDFADIARLGFVTRARVTQIMNLLLLAPDIQESLLHSHPKVEKRLSERYIRTVAAVDWWESQRATMNCFERHGDERSA